MGQIEEKQLKIRKAEEMRLLKEGHSRLQTEQLKLHIIGKDRQKIEEEKIRSIALVEKAKIKVEKEAKIKAEKEAKKRLKNIASVLDKYKKNKIKFGEIIREHKFKVKELVKECSFQGLTKVPVEMLNPVRIISLKVLKATNVVFRHLKNKCNETEVKVYSANELTEIVQNAENSAISLYVSELQKTKLAEDPSTVKRNLVQTGNKEGRQEAHTSILNYQDKRQERMRKESKVYLKQINSDAIYSDNHGPKTNAVHIDNKERSQQDHTSILNYQDERQEQLFVDSKDYSKQINSDDIYSDIRAPKTFMNQQFSQLDSSHTSPIQTYQERQDFIPQKDNRPFRFDGTTESNSFNKTTEQQRSHIYPHQVTNFVTGNSSQVDGSNNSPQHQMTNQNIRRQPHHSHQHAISQGYNPPEDNQTFI